MSDITTREEWARRRMIRDVARYLDGVGPDNELQNVAIFAGYCGIPKETIREVWTGARAMREQEATAS